MYIKKSKLLVSSLGYTKGPICMFSKQIYWISRNRNIGLRIIRPNCTDTTFNI